MDNYATLQSDYSLQEDSYHRRGRVETITESLALGLLFLVSFVSNGIICTVLLQSNRRQTVSDVFLLSLVFANFFISVLVLPFVISAAIADEWPFGTGWCETSGLLLTFFTSASNFSIAAIAIQRYYIVVKPLALKIDLRRANYIVGFLWFSALSCAVPPLFGWNSYVYSSGKAGCTLWWASGGAALVFSMYYITTTFVIPLFIILFVYRAIYIKAKQQRKLETYVFKDISQNGYARRGTTGQRSIEHRKITCDCLPRWTSLSNDNHDQPELSSSYYNAPSPIIDRHTVQPRQVSRHSSVIQQRTFQSVSAIVVSFVVCLSPYLAFNIWISFHHPASPYDVIDFVTTWLYLSMTAVNPMTYGYSNRQIRRAVKRLPLVRRLFRQGRDRTYQMDLTTVLKAPRLKRHGTSSQSNQALEIERS